VEAFGGVYDATQMAQVLGMWNRNGNPAGATFKAVARKLYGKRSNKFTPEGKHNFMHDKIVVCDNAVVTGSFNLSSNATHNAENLLIIHDPKIANEYDGYIDKLIAAYK
jgi:phosphatidylserine/phosphatidylglycerophosphate/cardiolipin synthase-like enzyme